LQCPQCNSTNPRPQPMRWNDPGVFSAVTFQMINLNQEDRQRLLVANNRDAALETVLSGKLEPGIGAAINFADRLMTICPDCGTRNESAAKFCDQCGVKLYIDKSQIIFENVLLPSNVIDDLVTFALLWDLPGTSSLRFKQAWSPIERFGIADLIYLEKFPVSLVGLGYRRQRSKRPATLCFFPVSSGQKKIRVFTNSTEVEACGVRLEPGAVLNWLYANDILTRNSEVGSISSRNAFDELQMMISHDPILEQIVLGLLHTISHAYIIGLSWCSGMDLSSFSEELLPGALIVIVHAGDTSLGGLSSVFSQVPWQPFELATNDLVACQLDPSCTEDDGGACVACLHLPLGCSMWNSLLSRSYLFGGQIKEDCAIKQGFWQQ